MVKKNGKEGFKLEGARRKSDRDKETEGREKTLEEPEEEEKGIRGGNCRKGNEIVPDECRRRLPEGQIFLKTLQ
ncbi:MAG: hypothetical protein CVU55_05190 [Deltaproteobacteria bacterium HGW-Deltaproteobacteria-13]|jgi:hypothetical protein|nr:MAG: hypothetical protein CVU55_05190 [Deltaproteobacteria bacterium HGW-Deltaproteobacteria-13]